MFQHFLRNVGFVNYFFNILHNVATFFRNTGQHFSLFFEASFNIFQKCPTFLRNVGFINYFLKHFAKCCNIFLKCWAIFFSIFFRPLPTFFRNVTIFFKNVGFVNYLWSTFCKMLHHFLRKVGLVSNLQNFATFLKMLKKIRRPAHPRRPALEDAAAGGLGTVVQDDRGGPPGGDDAGR
jgi:hypothetical protein